MNLDDARRYASRGFDGGDFGMGWGLEVWSVIAMLECVFYWCFFFPP